MGTDFGDAQNTAVRAFLYNLTKKMCKQSKKKYMMAFNREGALEWQIIKDYFNNECAYCGEKQKLEKEHLFMKNQDQCGLDFLGNLIPCCHKCQKRKETNPANGKENKQYVNWKEHLKDCLIRVNKLEEYDLRLSKIENHLKNYPQGNINQETLKNLTRDLYKEIRKLIEKYLSDKSLGFSNDVEEGDLEDE